MRKIDRDKFYAGYRDQFGRLNQSQVTGLNFLLASMEEDTYLVDYRHAAYMLATTKRETGDTFQPVTENLNYSAKALLATWPKRFTPERAAEYAHQPEKIANYVYANRNGNGDEASGDGWKYRGRGDAQITGKGNYRAFNNVVHVDLVKNPELACNPQVAYEIISYGMRNGTFTGRRLNDYINPAFKNYVLARKIINGVDCAKKIAVHAEGFEQILAIAWGD